LRHLQHPRQSVSEHPNPRGHWGVRWAATLRRVESEFGKRRCSFLLIPSTSALASQVRFMSAQRSYPSTSATSCRRWSLSVSAAGPLLRGSQRSLGTAPFARPRSEERCEQPKPPRSSCYFGPSVCPATGGSDHRRAVPLVSAPPSVAPSASLLVRRSWLLSSAAIYQLCPRSGVGFGCRCGSHRTAREVPPNPSLQRTPPVRFLHRPRAWRRPAVASFSCPAGWCR
jgi:hypothetical protein